MMYAGPTGQQLSGLKSTGYQQVTMPQFTKEQMNLFKNMFSRVGPESFLSKLASGDVGQFEQMEAPARRQFAQMQSDIASRFSGLGSGARRSSGFQTAQNTAAQEFAQNLQAQRLGLQQQALRDLMGYSSDLLSQRPFENLLLEKQMPFWQQMLLGLAPAGLQGLSAAGQLGMLKKFGVL